MLATLPSVCGNGCEPGANGSRRTFPAKQSTMITQTMIALSRRDSSELGSIEKPELVKAETPRKAPNSTGSHGRVGVFSSGWPLEFAVEKGA